MEIHFFTKGDKNTGSSRQRAFWVAEKLSQVGLKVVVHSPSTELISSVKWPGKYNLIFQTIRNLFSIKKDDVVFLQRTVYNKYFFLLMVFYLIVFKRKVIFDFDDAIFIHSPFKTKIFVRMVDVVITGSHYLENWARKYNRNVHLIPTSVDCQKYETKSDQEYDIKGKAVLGWVGNGPAHYENLSLLTEVFKSLVEKKVDFKFVLVGSLGSDKVLSLFKNIIGLEFEYIDSLDWSNPNAVPSIIRTFDIGLFPLENNQWNLGKCSFKAVEYMACGMPTVASGVGENNNLIQNGENGFLVDTGEEWVKAIQKLVSGRELRIKIGQAARQTILERYSFESNIPKIAQIIKSIL